MTTADRLSISLSDRYRLERELGQGGMATVYLAEDLKHARKVAIKVLHPELSAVIGGERFLSEIKTTAGLQHPHILGLIDSGEADGLLYYVMPFIEGETLRARLAREKQLPVDDAIRLTKEVASALEFAHKRGIVHRDIKPENILLQDGQALVADFGIALAVQQAGGNRMTQTGMSLGTPAYMSPEQAMGEREIGARSDVYALGAMTYEMLTGEPPFTGPNSQAIVAKVLTEQPPLLRPKRPTVSPAVEHAVLTALQKLPADRFGSAKDFAEALDGKGGTYAATVAMGATRPARPTRLTRPVMLAAAALIATAAGAAGWFSRSSTRAGAPDVIRASLDLGDSTTVRAIGNARLAIAPSGQRVAFVGANGGEVSLWVRDLNQTVARALPDTKGAFAPFFSPDGQSIGFFTLQNAQAVMKITSIAEGVTRTVLQDSIAPFGGGSWGDDGQIYFTHASRGLARVAASGGAVTHVSRPDSAAGIQEHDYPDVLPGSRLAVVMLWKGSISSNHIGVVDLASGATTDLTEGSLARYAAPGFLAIGTADGRVLAARFDPRRGRLLGTPAAMLQDVQQESTNGTVQFAVSATGTIVYQQKAGSLDGLAWVARDGARTSVDSTLSGRFESVALSPDGTQIAVSRNESGSTQIWIKQLTTGAFSRLPFEAGDANRPAWAPDGRRVAFLGTRDARRTAWVRRADGSDSAQAAIPANIKADEIWFDPLGRYTLIRTEGTSAGTRQLWVFGTGKDSVGRRLIQSRFDHYGIALSPDGQWLAYVSEESGTPEVYVRPFPNADSARIAISVAGGTEPLWRRDGAELFFRNARGAMFGVAVTTGARFTHGTPQLLFSVPGLAQATYFRAYDVHPDNKRFLMVMSGGIDAKALQAIFNWRVELERLGKATE